jgi:hypothetical protein
MQNPEHTIFYQQMVEAAGTFSWRLISEGKPSITVYFVPFSVSWILFRHFCRFRLQ